ncbi:hypothetical protein BRAO375_1590027 [Bradyrhizobium sp. ORS 375]|uniref:YkoP family protein n=1 Tax=Bradyrhizobium sp. (strain ORS 375) TaxID=566679 RepID=UPI0002409081|nr:hypothetical protein [Bradyrhizobium sp. ORS 375]CCD91564.1 hypothetical protein BRAO375_1590027 [Bradyrhizobium sp. ORS 375]
MLSKLMATIDQSLRDRQHIFEYTSSASCLFRLQRAACRTAVMLPDGTYLPAGAPLLALHVWNEHVPPFSPTGPTLAWARRLAREIDLSLRELASFVASRKDFDDIVAISGTLAFGSDDTAPLMAELSARYGFAAAREQASTSRTVAERVHWFGENVLISLLVWSHNPAALRSNTLGRTRVAVYMPRAALIARFGRSPDQGPSRSQAGGQTAAGG